MPLIKAKANSAAPGGFQIPNLIKTTAASTDYFIGVDADGTLYKISKSNLLVGLSSGSDTPTIPLNAITGFDGSNQFLIEVGNDYLSY